MDYSTPLNGLYLYSTLHVIIWYVHVQIALICSLTAAFPLSRENTRKSKMNSYNNNRRGRDKIGSDNADREENELL
jgi:hypothetical protein